MKIIIFCIIYSYFKFCLVSHFALICFVFIVHHIYKCSAKLIWKLFDGGNSCIKNKNKNSGRLFGTWCFRERISSVFQRLFSKTLNGNWKFYFFFKIVEFWLWLSRQTFDKILFFIICHNKKQTATYKKRNMKIKENCFLMQ